MRSRSFLGLVLVSVSLLGAAVALAPATGAGRAADVRSEATRNLAQGVAAHKRGEYAVAVTKLQAASAVALNNFRAYYYLGLALTGDRRYKDALDALAVALDLDPSHLQSHIAVGDARLKLGDLTEAHASYYRALELRAAYAPALDGLARIEEAQSKPDEAIVHYRQAIASDRGFAPAYTHLGDLYLRQGRFEEAVQLLEEAVAIRPDNAPGLNRLAVAYGRLGFENQAVATIHRAIELEPKNALHVATLGGLQLLEGFVATAETTFRRALELDAALPEARMGLAEVARRRGGYDAALAELDVALADPRTDAKGALRARDLRAAIAAERDEVARIEALIEQGTATPADLRSLATVYAGRGLWSDAADLERSAGDAPEARDRLAYMLFQAGRFSEAHALWAALDTLDGGARVALNAGVALARLGDDAAAVEAYRRAAARDPALVEAAMYQGNSLLRLGRTDEAAAQYKAFLDAGPRGEDAERVRRILRRIAPALLPPEPAAPPPPPVPTVSPDAEDDE